MSIICQLSRKPENHRQRSLFLKNKDYKWEIVIFLDETWKKDFKVLPTVSKENHKLKI